MNRTVEYYEPLSDGTTSEVHKQLASWLDIHHDLGWTDGALAAASLCLFKINDELAALIWFPWVDKDNRVLSVHVCADPKYRKRWATKKELNKLYALSDIITPRPKVVLAELRENTFLFLQYYGFTFCQTLPFAYLEIK